jgi:hypothetical protein
LAKASLTPALIIRRASAIGTSLREPAVGLLALDGRDVPAQDIASSAGKPQRRR